MRTLAAVAVAALVIACAAPPRYSYRPRREPMRAQADGRVVAAYLVPSQAPRGDVQLTAVGVTRATLPEGGHSRHAQLLTVRMQDYNGDDAPWTVDAREQRLGIGSFVQLAPRRAACEGRPLAVVVLLPGETRALELAYELPDWVTDAEALPVFRIEWRVDTPARVVARQSTAFELAELPPPPPRKPPRAGVQQARVTPPDPLDPASGFGRYRHWSAPYGR